MQGGVQRCGSRPTVCGAQVISSEGAVGTAARSFQLDPLEYCAVGKGLKRADGGNMVQEVVDGKLVTVREAVYGKLMTAHVC